MEAVHELVSEHAATFTFGGLGLSCWLGQVRAFGGRFHLVRAL